MKILDLVLILITNFLVIANQILLKNWISKYEIKFLPLNWDLFKSLISWEFLGAIAALLGGGMLWVELLKRLDLGVLYPVSTGITFILLLFSAMYFLGEQVSLMRWIGAAIILVGIIVISRS
jgi:multidrug transporter EmrE-like cation transporter